ncbi:DMT family transporter [Aliarcobacter butzleri]|uniref:DMT family transporter n=1 Tax=Aliarcobacter butzleri TaxID=28197 RepID=UPI00263CB95A|nr:DMT family transporter [Aliarcobacter butzleri]MDN5088480.1 DMT family transporter [Aliarcobacter butzleri]
MIQKSNTKYFIGMFIAMIIWGIAWTSGKAATSHSSPEVAAFWRYAISFLTIIPVVLYMKTSLKTDKIGLFYMVGAGILSALYNYLFFVGLSHGDAGFGGTIVTSIAPIITYILSIIIFKIEVSIKQILALAIGIFGALILLRVPYEGFNFLNINSLYFLACAVVWAMITIFSQKASKRADPMFYILIVFGITGFINMIFALPYHPFAFSSYDYIFWLNIIYIGIFSGSFSMTLFFISASKIGAHNTGVFMFIVPIGAIISSYLVYNEKIVLSTVIGCLLSFVAVILFNNENKKKLVEA